MNLPDREATLGRLSALAETDVLIIGGGINGAGLLRELAINSVSTVLVDKGDFASGATSASSRMIHGGLRYLENGEFRLVAESLAERDRLLRNAPHAVAPLPTTIPILSVWAGLTSAVKRLVGGASRPGSRGAILIGLGLFFYDLLSIRHRILPAHRMSGRRAALATRPWRTDIAATATYYDAMVALPERLCLELIDDALTAEPASIAANYVAATGQTDGVVRLEDQVSGQVFKIRPKVVVNASGAWIDFANAALGEPSRFIGGTKGSHLVLNHPELLAATGGHQIFHETEDGRICIFFPLHGRVLAGSTDLHIDDPDQAVCDDDEADYILRSVTSVFPTIQVGREHIVSRFCGVRPLPRADTLTTGQISRDHSVAVTLPDDDRPWPVYSMVGGKWTTFRSFSEQVADRVMLQLDRPRRATSRDLPIGGHSPAPDLAETASLQRACRTEAVVHLDDLILRRTSIGLFDPPDAAGFAEIAALAGDALGWTSARVAAEAEAALSLLARRHAVFPSAPQEARP